MENSENHTQENGTPNTKPDQVTVSIRNMPINIWNMAHANARAKRMTLKDYIISLVLGDASGKNISHE